MDQNQKCTTRAPKIIFLRNCRLENFKSLNDLYPFKLTLIRSYLAVQSLTVYIQCRDCT